MKLKFMKLTVYHIHESIKWCVGAEAHSLTCFTSTLANEQKLGNIVLAESICIDCIYAC